MTALLWGAVVLGVLNLVGVILCLLGLGEVREIVAWGLHADCELKNAQKSGVDSAQTVK